MPKTKQATGRPARLSGLLGIICLIVGVFLYAAKLPMPQLPSLPSPSGTQQTQQHTPFDPADLPDLPSADPTGTQPATGETTPTETPAPSAATYPVASITDGDTIKVSIDGKAETLRLIGINTPEIKGPYTNAECFGTEAKTYVTGLLTGKNVRLAADPTQQDRDKYNRLLRYVFFEDGTNINKQIIAEGYAYEYTYKVPYQYQKEFKEAEAAAQSAQKGLWSPSTCNGKK